MLVNSKEIMMEVNMGKKINEKEVTRCKKCNRVYSQVYGYLSMCMSIRKSVSRRAKTVPSTDQSRAQNLCQRCFEKEQTKDV